jgi:hypothetical protein
MPVRLFVQEHSGDFNLDIELESRKYARGAIRLIVSTGGYWFDGYIYTETTPVGPIGCSLTHTRYDWKDDNRSIFIPLHRIDRMEIQD